jgi:glycine oxidase
MIVIIGGGICGLGIGWRLAKAGRDVTIVDRGEAAMAATWAAAGMLAPQAEAEHAEEALLPLAMESCRMWQTFSDELRRCSGIDVDYRTEGTLVVALDRDDFEMLEHRFTYLRDLGLNLEWLSGDEARQKEPYLSRGVSGALFSPEDHQVDNRLVGSALKACYIEAGGHLRENTSVDEILTNSGRVTGVRVGDQEIKAEVVVVAAGAWSRNIAGLPPEVSPPVRPLKGQMAAIQMPEAAPILQHVLWGPGNSIVPSIYLAPKSDGRLIIGATVEEMGFDTSLTAGGMLEILRSAWEVLPGIYDLPLVESWAGLRPASRDDAPILGPTEMDGLVMATGHHRNGILLAPITADTVSDYILTGNVADIMRPFMLNRFCKSPTAAGHHAMIYQESVPVKV